jgi:hypothetical protein
VAPLAGVIQGLLVVGFLLALWRMAASIRSLPRCAAQGEPTLPTASVTETADSIPTRLPNRAKSRSSPVSR